MTDYEYHTPEAWAGADRARMAAMTSDDLGAAAPVGSVAEPAETAGEWHHARWFDPHSAYPKDGTVKVRRAHPDRLTAECAACGEILLGPAAPVPAVPAEPAETLADEWKQAADYWSARGDAVRAQVLLGCRASLLRHAEPAPPVETREAAALREALIAAWDDMPYEDCSCHGYLQTRDCWGAQADVALRVLGHPVGSDRYTLSVREAAAALVESWVSDPNVHRDEKPDPSWPMIARAAVDTVLAALSSPSLGVGTDSDEDPEATDE